MPRGLTAATSRSLGRSGVEVTALGLGCAPLGNLFSPVSDDEATSTIDAAWTAGIRFFDTAPLYGSGLSERRLGAGLADRGGAVVASKVGRVLDDTLIADPIFVDVPACGPRFDFSVGGVRASLDASLERLGRDRLDIGWVHDPDDHETEAAGAALPTLRDLRDEGLVGAIGVGMNQSEMPARFVAAGLVDAVLIAGQFNLLDQHAARTLLPSCRDRGIGVVVGGVFGSGLLADPWAADPHYRYAPAPGELIERARAMQEVCERHGTSIVAASLQFPFLHPAVSAIVVGARTPAEVHANITAFETPVPDQVWGDLVAADLVPRDLLPG